MAKWGFSQIDVTPELGIFQGGFADRPGPSDDYLDNLYLRAVAVDDGENVFVWISAELCLVSNKMADEFRERVSRALNIPKENTIFTVTHSHATPWYHQVSNEGQELYDRYFERMYYSAEKTALQALKNTEQAEIDIVLGTTDIGICRREEVDGRYTIGEDENGIIDKSLRILRVRSTDTGEYLGFIIRSSCHPVCLYSKNTKISGDFCGRACKIMELTYPGAIALFVNGTPGDINPKRYSIETDNACLARTTNIFVSDIKQLLNKEFVSIDQKEKIGVAEVMFEVPLQNFTRAERESEYKIIEGYAQKAENPEAWDITLAKLYKEWMTQSFDYIADGKPLNVTVNLQTIRLPGNIIVFAIPYEPVSSFSFNIERMMLERYGMNKKNIFTLGYANGGNGYLVTEKELREGGYEPHMSIWYTVTMDLVPSYYAFDATDKMSQKMIDLYESFRSPS